MDAVLTALGESGIATYLRGARWGYAAVNAGHLLGIAVLIGGILPLDLRLLGVWSRVDAGPLVRVLVPMAAAGLILAVASGILLFSVRPQEYAANPAFLAKIVLLCIGGASALATHLVWGRWLDRAPRVALVRAALVSMTCWIGALVAGRLIAFTLY